MELLIRLVTANLTVTGWLGTALMMIVLSVHAVVCEAARRATLTAVIERCGPGTCVLDRRRGRTILVVRPPVVEPAVAVVLVGQRPA